MPVQVVRTGLRSVAFGLGGNQLEMKFMPPTPTSSPATCSLPRASTASICRNFPVAKVVNVERDSACSFARITCTPVAGVENFGEVMILDPRQALPRSPRGGVP